MYNHCSYSGGTYTALVQSIITDYCDTARTVGNWTETSIATRANLIYKDNDVTALRSNSCDPIDAALVLAAKDKLDIAKIKSAGAIMYFHTVTDDDLALILEIVDYAIAEGFDICTIDELHTKMTT